MRRAEVMLPLSHMQWGNPLQLQRMEASMVQQRHGHRRARLILQHPSPSSVTTRTSNDVGGIMWRQKYSQWHHNLP